MATRATLKALTAATETLNNTNIVANGNITAVQLNNIISGLVSNINAVVDAIFDNDNVTRVSSTFTAATSVQNDALIGAGDGDYVLFFDGTESSTRQLVSSLNNTTGTLTFVQPLTGPYKLYIFNNA